MAKGNKSKANSAKAKAKAKAKVQAGPANSANTGAGYANQQNHRHKVIYAYPHESMETSFIEATDVWQSGDPSGMAVCDSIARH